MLDGQSKQPYEVVDEAVDGDPFVQIVRCGDQHFRLDEGALIEMFHRNDEAFLDNLFGKDRP